MTRKMALAVLLLVLPGFALAQTTGSVVGTITDEDGNPVTGASLTFSSPEMQGDRVAKTGDDGNYTMALLRPGNYLVTAAAPGKANVQYTFRLQLGEKYPLSFTMAAGATREEKVTVYGTTSKMEATEQGETFNYDRDVDQLPIQDRRLEAVGQFAPNVSFGPTTDRLRSGNPDLAISGAPAIDTIVLLDGSEISDPLFSGGTVVYAEDSVQELQVMTSGISAKHGRFMGGVLNAITKGGGNDYHAALRWVLDREDWNGQTPFQESQAGDLNEIYYATLSGRILRDHLWFYVTGRKIPGTTRNTTPFVNNGGTVSFSQASDEERIQGRLTGAINANHTFDFSYLDYDASTSNRAGLPAGDPDAIGDRTDPRDMQILSYQGVLTPNLFLEARWTNKDVAIASGGDPAKGSPFIDWNNFRIYNNHWWDVTDKTLRNNETAAANLTQVLPSSRFGNHTLEYGVQWVDSQTGGDNRQSSTGYNFISYDTNFVIDSATGLAATGATDPANLIFDIVTANDNQRLVALSLGGGQSIENTGVYVQDSVEFKGGKWRIDAGLRWDDYDGSGPLPQFGIDYDILSPRVAATYNINDTWQLQGSFGQYTGRLNDNWVQAATGVGDAPGVTFQYTGPDQLGLTDTQVEAVLRSGAINPFTGLPEPVPAACDAGGGVDLCWAGAGAVLDVNDPAQPTTLVSDNLGSPYARDFNISLKRRLPRNTGTFVITYSNREFNDLVDDFVGVAVTGLASGLVTDPFGTPASFPVDFSVIDNNPAARREYEGIAATFDYRPSAVWNIGGNYTLSETTGNYEGEGTNTPGEFSPLGDYPTTRAADEAAPFGFLDEDIKHRINVWGNYVFDFDRSGSLVLGGLAQYQSGRPFDLETSVPRGVDPANCCAASTFTRFFNGRGQQRDAGAWNLDLSALYRITAWKQLSFWVKASAVNITNEGSQVAAVRTGSDVANAAGVLEFVPSASFGTAGDDGDYQRPREWTFTVGANW